MVENVQQEEPVKLENSLVELSVSALSELVKKEKVD